jgi:hypothetical protein
MKPGAPWNTRDLRFDALERAREAERRSERFASRPSTVNSPDLPPRRRYETSESSDWGALLDPRRYAGEEGRNWGADQRQSFGRGEARQPRADSIDAVNRRLDELTRQLDHLAKINSVTAQRRGSGEDEGLRKLTAAITRLDQRLEQMISEGRRAVGDIERRVSAFDRTLSDFRSEGPWRSSPDLPSDEIAGDLGYAPPVPDREAATPSMSRLPEAPHYTGASAGQQLSGLQKQIEQLTSRTDGATFLREPDPERAGTTRRGPFQPESAQRPATGFSDTNARRYNEAAAPQRYENTTSALAGRLGS